MISIDISAASQWGLPEPTAAWLL